jgi:single-strand DNA-binding protein
MSEGINKVILVGRTGRDPEIKYTQSGTAIAKFSIATSETWKDKQSGEKQEKTEWHRCVAFNRTAEIIGEYVKKGMLLYCEGKLQTSSWEQDGVAKYMTEIVVHQMQMLGGKGENKHNTDHRDTGRPTTPPAASSDYDDGEIPF